MSLKLCFACLSIFFLIQAHAQNENTIKFYQNTDFTRITYKYAPDAFHEFTDSELVTTFNRLSAAYSLAGKKWLKEVELSYSGKTAPIERIEDKRPLFVAALKRDFDYASLQFEMLRILTGSGNFKFSLGPAATVFWARETLTPRDPYVYKRYNEIDGIILTVNGHAAYNLSDRLIIDINARLGIFEGRLLRNKIYNPSIPIRHQENFYQEYNFLPVSYVLRVGVGYQF
jgi:hypothetical protein